MASTTGFPGMIDAHTFSLDWQGNVYSKAAIASHGSQTTKLIVATLNRKVFCLELSVSHCARPCGCVVVPQCQELQFTYIPSGAEIISIDAFNRSTVGNDFVIGVTIIKSVDGGSPGQYLNIYSDQDSTSETELELDNLAQSCLSLELEFVPYQLSHCRLVEETPVWLLGGSDRRIHVYAEKNPEHIHMYTEVDPSLKLPEFQDPFPSVPLWTDIRIEGNVRISATGCECGFLQVTMVEISSCQVLSRFTHEFDGPLTCTRLFRVEGEPEEAPACLSFPRVTKPDTSELAPLHLCVTYSLGSSKVFRDVLNAGLSDSMKLPLSNRYDTATCICVADLDLSGQKKLLLGTYGQELLVYKQNEEQMWDLEWQRSLPAPILSLCQVDMTGDGVKELVVVTTRGVQVLQADLGSVKKVTIERLRSLVAAIS